MDFTSHKLELAKNWTWETSDLHAHGRKFIKAPDKQINAIWSSDDSQKERFDQRCAGRPAGPPSRPLCGAHTHTLRSFQPPALSVPLLQSEQQQHWVLCFCSGLYKRGGIGRDVTSHLAPWGQSF